MMSSFDGHSPRQPYREGASVDRETPLCSSWWVPREEIAPVKHPSVAPAHSGGSERAGSLPKKPWDHLAWSQTKHGPDSLSGVSGEPSTHPRKTLVSPVPSFQCPSHPWLGPSPLPRPETGTGWLLSPESQYNTWYLKGAHTALCWRTNKWADGKQRKNQRKRTRQPLWLRLCF